MPATPKTSLFRTGVAGELSHLFNDVVHRTDFLHAKSVECELDNLIHPIFDACQWLGIDPVYYYKIKPALQLASLWITDDRLLDWIYHDTASTVQAAVRNNEVKYYLGLPPGMSIHDPAGRARARAMWYEKLLDITRSRELFFHHSAYAHEICGAWGVTFYHPHHMNEYHGNPLNPDTRKYAHIFAMNIDGNVMPVSPAKPQILLSHLFQNFAASVPLDTFGLNKELKLELLCFYFFMATTIVHELMHVIGFVPHFRDWDSQWGTAKEVYHSLEEIDAPWAHWMNNGRPECGASWQLHTFGAPILPKITMLPAHQRYVDLDDPSCFVLGKSFLIFQEKHLWRHREMFHHNGIPIPSIYGGLMVPGEDFAKWFRKEHWAPERTWGQMVQDKAEWYIFDVRLHIGDWEREDSWNLDTPVTVKFDVYNSCDIQW